MKKWNLSFVFKHTKLKRNNILICSTNQTLNHYPRHKCWKAGRTSDKWLLCHLLLMFFSVRYEKQTTLQGSQKSDLLTKETILPCEKLLYNRFGDPDNRNRESRSTKTNNSSRVNRAHLLIELSQEYYVLFFPYLYDSTCISFPFPSFSVILKQGFTWTKKRYAVEIGQQEWYRFLSRKRKEPGTFF